ncbi:uncharacterized protein P884DRAFT_106262 [Thermothelomyces heterothallicus CBS 202.75]|uniref:uncharacterized protein n=1 Tax=Thermothelomyces heterothallicus CBS 202.75 TaxID=1149848 RepID=UPI00374215D9
MIFHGNTTTMGCIGFPSLGRFHITRSLVETQYIHSLPRNRHKTPAFELLTPNSMLILPESTQKVTRTYENKGTPRYMLVTCSSP